MADNRYEPEDTGPEIHPEPEEGDNLSPQEEGEPDQQDEAEDDPNFMAGLTTDNAVLLLAAAEDQGVDPWLVRTDTYRSGYVAPEEVVSAAKAGVTEPANEKNKE
jgi:hypothetical protein